jgi:hypothetical protein
LRIYIHNQSVSPISSESINVRVGQETTVTIKKTFSHRTPYPYSSCIDLTTFKSELYTATINEKSSKEYRQIDCFNLCLQRMIIKNCNCFHPRFNRLSSSNPCHSLADLECIGQQENEFKDEKLNECLKECPLECMKQTFDLQVSSLDYPTVEDYELLKKDEDYFKGVEKSVGDNITSFDDYRSHFLLINIFYPYLQYTEITEMPKTSIIELISNMGGSMGIFLGFTLFSLFEVSEVLCLIVYKLVVSSIKQRKIG